VFEYALLKAVHITAVTVSFAGFTARGLALWRGASWIRHPLTRRLPHLVDTLLLLSALGMLWVARLSPWALPWLRAKLLGLVLYIALGAIALSPSRTADNKPPGLIHVLCWIGALAVYVYIVSVSVTKSALGLLLRAGAAG
jgi:uncharacterized membrane protein SirB2